MRILHIEDDDVVATMVRSGLSRAGFATDSVTTAEDGLAAIRTVEYDAAVIDMRLPLMSGLELLRHLRAARNPLPIIIASADHGLAARVAGLNAGADDYLAKPFDLTELIARLQALLRRPRTMPELELNFGNVQVLAGGQFVVAGIPLALPRREAALLRLLMRSPKRPLAKPTIEDRLYAFGHEVASNAVEVHVHYLRRRLREAGASCTIETIRGSGYALRIGVAETPLPRRKRSPAPPSTRDVYQDVYQDAAIAPGVTPAAS